MVWAKRAAAQLNLGPCAPSKPANSPTQIATIMAKKSCPSEAWAMVAQAGVRKRTATPPSAACARTTATAAQARRVLWGGPPGPRGAPWTRTSLEEPGSDLKAYCHAAERGLRQDYRHRRPGETGAVGRTPWSARVALDPHFARRTRFLHHRGRPTRASAADQGVRPTIS